MGSLLITSLRIVLRPCDGCLDQLNEIVNSAFFIFFAVVCFASPLLIAVVMLIKFKRLDIASVKQSIG